MPPNEKTRAAVSPKYPSFRITIRGCPFFCCGYRGRLGQQIVRFPDMKLARKRKQCGRIGYRMRISAAAQGTSGRSAHSKLVHSLFVKSSNTAPHLQHSKMLAERDAYFLPRRTIYLRAGDRCHATAKPNRAIELARGRARSTASVRDI